ncbi:MAG: hypothetical protein NTU81_00930 [Candidatus Nomurabacteria bacterium]|nr:hypothetical protein [Candidatus Nomurabacteria bacterium]
MFLIILIFLIAIISLFTMMMFRAWEIETSRIERPDSSKQIVPELSFRYIEKIILYLVKHILQSIVLMLVKTWFIVITKTKKWTKKNLPKIAKFFKKKSKDLEKQRDSFVRRAIIESKTKIKRIKEKVRKEHE